MPMYNFEYIEYMDYIRYFDLLKAFGYIDRVVKSDFRIYDFEGEGGLARIIIYNIYIYQYNV